jgi:hypothetical protein
LTAAKKRAVIVISLRLGILFFCGVLFSRWWSLVPGTVEVFMKEKQHKLTWSKGALVLATCGAMAAMSSVARANLVLVGSNGLPVATVAASFVDLGAQGFGNAPRLLTLQTNTVETGSGTPVDVANGDAVPGANKTTTPTLGTLGWTSGNKVGIGFNSDQSGQTGITMQSLVLTIFNGTTPVGSFSLAPSLTPLQFSATDLALQQGNGNAVFDFGLTAAEQAQFQTLLAMSGSSGFFAGVSSQLGCPTGAPASCQPSNDGPDSFIGFIQPSAIPLPGALPLFVTGLVGLALLGRGKRKAVAA